MLEVWRKEQKNTKQIDHGMSSIEINEEMFKIKWSIKRHCFANVRTLGLTDTLEPLEQPKVSWFILPFLKDLSNTKVNQSKEGLHMVREPFKNVLADFVR